MNRPTATLAWRATPLAMALVALFAAGVANAETSPWYVGARETVTHDSNVYRTETPTSDTVFTTGLFGGLDQPISRQRLRANVAANWNRYRDTDALNHTDGTAGLRLDWETIGHLSGDAQVNYNRKLYRDFALSNEAQRVVYNTTDAAFNARLGVVTAWTLEAGAFGSRTRYDQILANSNIDYDGYRAGVRYAESSILSLGLAYRHTNGKYPNASQGDFDRDDADLLLNWNPSGSSTLAGRISRTRLKFPNIGDRSDSLNTGSLTYQWRPGGRFTLDALVERDSSAGQTLSDVVVLVGPGIGISGRQLSASTRVATTSGLSAGYELTGKIKLALDLRHTTRDLDNDITRVSGPTTSGAQIANDKTDSASLSATYDATRNLQFSCGFTHMKRTVGGPDSAALTYPYSVNLTSCTAQFAVQP